MPPRVIPCSYRAHGQIIKCQTISIITCYTAIFNTNSGNQQKRGILKVEKVMYGTLTNIL